MEKEKKNKKSFNVWCVRRHSKNRLSHDRDQTHLLNLHIAEPFFCVSKVFLQCVVSSSNQSYSWTSSKCQVQIRRVSSIVVHDIGQKGLVSAIVSTIVNLKTPYVVVQTSAFFGLQPSSTSYNRISSIETSSMLTSMHREYERGLLIFSSLNYLGIPGNHAYLRTCRANLYCTVCAICLFNYFINYCCVMIRVLLSSYALSFYTLIFVLF